MLGFQVRSHGAPGPLTMKEVEELEQLTQQLMQDMEHPQRQNVAVHGEPTTHPLRLVPLFPDSSLRQLIPCKLMPFLLFIYVFSGLPRVLWPVSPAPGTGTARSSCSGAAVPHHLLYLSPV